MHKKLGTSIPIHFRLFTRGEDNVVIGKKNGCFIMVSTIYCVTVAAQEGPSVFKKVVAYCLSLPYFKTPLSSLARIVPC